MAEKMAVLSVGQRVDKMDKKMVAKKANLRGYLSVD